MKVTDRVSQLTASDIGAVGPSDLIQQGGTAPLGAIALWSGADADIPLGWYLCDGTDDTPDMRGLFALGTTVNADIGDTGGDNSPSVSASTTAIGTVGDTTLTISQLPAHNHGGYEYNYGSSWEDNWRNVPGESGDVGVMNDSGFTGGNQSHNHSFTCSVTSTSVDVDATPLYWALAFIMYKGVV